MTEFQEDMIFKDVCEEDARTFLDILGKKSKKVKIITKELRQLDPTTFVPDIILELDDEILIIELQSIKVERKHHQRFYIYVAISTYRLNEFKKEVNLEWLIVDKFVEDTQKRNILCDLLGDRMSLIHEYAENKEKKGIKKGFQKGEDKIILNLLRAGQAPHKIARDAGVPLSRVNGIKRRFNI